MEIIVKYKFQKSSRIKFSVSDLQKYKKEIYNSKYFYLNFNYIKKKIYSDHYKFFLTIVIRHLKTKNFFVNETFSNLKLILINFKNVRKNIKFNSKNKI
jgi:hypothetical protein